MPVTVTIDSVGSIGKTLRELSHKRVLVGVPSSGDARDSGEIGNADLAYIHENGSPEANIPARPFLKPGVERSADKIEKRLGDAIDAAVSGNSALVDKNLNALGLEVVSEVRAIIQASIPPPLKPATIAARRRRSRGSSYRRKATSASDTTPLIDTGQLLAAITYVVRNDNE